MKLTLQMATYALGLILGFGSLASASERVQVGRYHSRAILNRASGCSRPAVILIPGSGANGPEEMMPASLSGDGKDHSIFEAFASGLGMGNVTTLQLGKPGIEYFSSFDQAGWFYDREMYVGLGWQGLVDNVADAVEYVRGLECVDPSRIFILGHSEGTVVAVDYAHSHPGRVRGLILVGFSGESLSETVDWQFYRRPIDSWLALDVDTNHDGAVSQAEASLWPEFEWTFDGADDVATFAEIEAALRADPKSREAVEKLRSSKVWEGVYDRAPIYSLAAGLVEDLYVYTGDLDVQTRPEEALRLEQECRAVGKANCYVTIVPGLGHGMSEPRGSRKQRFLDLTLVPVDSAFVGLMGQLGGNI